MTQSVLSGLITHVYHFQFMRQFLSVGTIASSNEHMKTLAKKDPNDEPIVTPSN